MNFKRIFTNATFSVIQTIVSGITLFILYKFVIDRLGTVQLGLWSVILASTSVARLSDLGITGSVVKFVARYLARNEPENAASVVQTAVITIAVTMAVVCLAVYPFLDKILAFAIPSDSMGLAIIVLPWAVFTLWLAGIGGVFQSALDGCHRMDIKNAILIFANIAFLVAAFWLVPAYGLKGLAIGQATQAVLVMFLTWHFLRKQIQMPVIPREWSTAKFKEMFSYSLNFQINSIAIMLFDPVVKLLMSKYGGLPSAAFYEMASQFVTKLRALIISANQAFVPAVAELHEVSPDKIKQLYSKTFGLVIFLAIPLFSIIILALPPLSQIWIGHLEPQFIIYGVLLAIGLGINTVSGPAYFFNLGTGKLNLNTAAHVILSALSISLGILLGPKFGGLGIAFSATLSLAISSLIIIFFFHRDSNIDFKNSIKRMHIFQYLSSLFVITCALIFYQLKTSKLEDQISHFYVFLIGSIFIFLSSVTFMSTVISDCRMLRHEN